MLVLMLLLVLLLRRESQEEALLRAWSLTRGLMVRGIHLVAAVVTVLYALRVSLKYRDVVGGCNGSSFMAGEWNSDELLARVLRRRVGVEENKTAVVVICVVV